MLVCRPCGRTFRLPPPRRESAAPAAASQGAPKPAGRSAAPPPRIAIRMKDRLAVKPAAPPAAPETKTPGVKRWQCERQESFGTPLTLQELKSMIRAGDLQEEERLAEEGADLWIEARDIPELKNAFTLRKRATGLQREGEKGADAPVTFCVAHPGRKAEYFCKTCSQTLCRTCVATPAPGKSPAGPSCARCGQPVDPLEEKVRPFWEDIVGLLQYPVKNWGWMTLLIMGALYWMGTRFLLGAIFLLICYVYLLQIIRTSANGRNELPSWGELSDLWEILARGFKVILVTLITWSPLIVFNLFLMRSAYQSMAYGRGPVSPRAVLASGLLFILVNAILLILMFIYYPMALAIVGVCDTIKAALNPVSVFRYIAAIKKDYAVVLVFWIVLEMIFFGTAAFYSFLPILGGMILALVRAYVFFIEFHILGWMAYQTEDRLNWGGRHA
jgi:hypothetical protein